MQIERNARRGEAQKATIGGRSAQKRHNRVSATRSDPNVMRRKNKGASVMWLICGGTARQVESVRSEYLDPVTLGITEERFIILGQK